MLLLDEMCGLGVDEVLTGDEDPAKIKSASEAYARKHSPSSKALVPSLGTAGDAELAAKLKHEKEVLDKQLEEVTAEAARLQVGGWRLVFFLLVVRCVRPIVSGPRHRGSMDPFKPHPSMMLPLLTQDVVDELEAKLSKKATAGSVGDNNKELMARNTLLEKKIKKLEEEVSWLVSEKSCGAVH